MQIWHSCNSSNALLGTVHSQQVLWKLLLKLVSSEHRWNDVNATLCLSVFLV